jgi:hypothetical protein
MDERLTVRLHKILRAPWAIPPVEHYRVIGTVHRGMEFGFLAIARNGAYLQVNGSVVQRLNRGAGDGHTQKKAHACRRGCCALRPPAIVRSPQTRRGPGSRTW